MSARKKIKINDPHKCRECAFCEIVTNFHTLSVKGEPTLGKCPHYTNREFCVLLSQQACDKFRLNE